MYSSSAPVLEKYCGQCITATMGKPSPQFPKKTWTDYHMQKEFADILEFEAFCIFKWNVSESGNLTWAKSRWRFWTCKTYNYGPIKNSFWDRGLTFMSQSWIWDSDDYELGKKLS